MQKEHRNGCVLAKAGSGSVSLEKLPEAALEALVLRQHVLGHLPGQVVVHTIRDNDLLRLLAMPTLLGVCTMEPVLGPQLVFTRNEALGPRRAPL